MLKSEWISQTSATQRKGRAGRCQPGSFNNEIELYFNEATYKGSLDDVAFLGKKVKMTN